MANFEAGVEGFTTRAFRGCGIVTSEPFEVSDGTHSTTELDRSAVTPTLLTRCDWVLWSLCADMEAVQMLQRFTQVGEFYVMSPPINPPDDGKSGAMDVLLYDEESDRHVRITWESALEACCIGGLPLTTPIGSAYKDILPKNLSDALAAATAAANVAAVTAAEEAIDAYYSPKRLKDALLAATGDTAATTAVKKAMSDYPRTLTVEKWKDTADEWSALNKNWDKTKADNLKPVCIVIARPFIEHAMLSAVLTVSGGDTGATIFGPSDMQISANTSVKTIEGCDCLFEPTNTHSHVPYTLQLRGTGSLPRTHSESTTASGIL